MEVIGPAVEGTKNVLEACAKTKGGVKRVVLTSSVAAIYGKIVTHRSLSRPQAQSPGLCNGNNKYHDVNM